ncbi:hypothetical protein M406DRAFT_325249 [Cryphonectria parasitica EP155]|uniref:Uncharacterized protein n=1 Tax=Cryphonectria parasitica (strain ATCC 38755 / EP155) TaxID=660469 RepID=A0A9P4YB22_CRYP1|nr:uncharacterized protein M406DRAFT_325249 [Cryphonectria parasitica EP155]KAF3769763.1 hypothetical protein M406DRAFT_325249 [Cryphonectria parasitica EP155]
MAAYNFVNVSVIQPPSSGFGLQSAIKPPYSTLGNSVAIDLYQGGCGIGDKDSVNCSLACQDSQYLFKSTYTIANCLTLAYAANLVPNASLITGHNSAVEALGAFVGLEHMSQFDFNTTIDNFLYCTAAACTNDSLITCGSQVQKIIADSPMNTSSTKLLTTIEAVASLCDDGAGLLVVFYALSLWACDVPHFISKSWSVREKRKVVDVQPGWRERTGALIHSTMVDFQEAQIYFALALATGTFMAAKDPGASGETHYEAVYVDHMVKKWFLVLALSTLSISQLMVFMTSQRSWYKTAISIITVVLSTVFYVLLPPIQNADDYPTITHNPDWALSECGGHASPVVRCSNTFWSSFDKSFKLTNTTTVLAVPYLAFSWRLAYQFVLSPKSSSTAPDSQRRVMHLATPLARTIVLGFTHAFILAYCYIVMINILIAFLANSSWDWSPDKIWPLAILWFSVAIKSAYLVLAGFAKIFGMRLPKPYIF